MIFRPKLANKILGGKKTQTRRRVKGDNDRCTYKVGRTYAVQKGRNSEGIGRILITGVRTELLEEITFEDARREGFRTREEFFAYWRELYGERARLDVLVWVISFELDRSHKPRLLLSSGNWLFPPPLKDEEVGYTREPGKALMAEPEAIGQDALEDYAKQGRERFEASRSAERRARAERNTLEARLAEVRRRAKTSPDVDVSSDIRLIERKLADAERKLDRAA